MTDWKERLLLALMAGGTAAGCTQTKQNNALGVNQAQDPCFSTPDPVRCSKDRAAGDCARVPDPCCGKPNSLICANNVCMAVQYLENSFTQCCYVPDPTACAIARCAVVGSDTINCPDAGPDGSIPDAADASPE